MRRAMALRRPRRLSIFAVVSVVLVWLAAFFAGLRSPDAGASWSDAPILLGFALFIAVGSFLVIRVPTNAVSWVVLGLAAAAGALALTGFLGQPGGDADPTTIQTVFSYFNLASLLGFVVLGGAILPLLFPTGSPPTPRWNWSWLSALVGLGLILVSVLMVGIIHGLSGALDLAQGDIGIFLPIELVGLGLMLTGIAGGVVSLAVRWHRSEGEERAQLRWLVPSFTVFGLGLIVEFGGAQDSPIATACMGLGIVFVPVAIGLAITRYRLYDIGKIVSRSVTYAIVAALIVGAYAIGAVWLPTRLGIESSVFVAATTLGVAVAFNPLRRWLTARLDRRFNRTPYDPDVVADTLAAELRETTDASAIAAIWARTTERALQPAAISVWVAE
jgi:hypothetical protein